MDALDKDSLPNDIESLKSLILAQQNMLLEKDQCITKNTEQLTAKNQRILLLEEYLLFFKHKIFGKSSERHTNQTDLFNEPEVLADIMSASDDQQAEASDSNKENTDGKPKKKRGRCPLPENIKRIKVYHDIPDDQKQCACGNTMEVFDEVMSEQLGIIPAKLYAIQHCRKKYSCCKCKNHVKTAPLPPQPIPKSNASPELIAHIVVSKFLDGLPFYRQEQIWKREQIDLSRATQANWSIQAGKLTIPLVNLLKDHQQTGKYINIDETTVQVLKEPDKPPDGKKYFWVTVGGPSTQPAYLFHYDPSRGTAIARALLEGYKGTVISDDWHIYERVCSALSLTHIACNDHARRKFTEAKAVEPVTHNKASSSESLADRALSYYKILYKIERKIKHLSDDEKLSERQERSLPIWHEFKSWIDEILPHVTPQSKMGKALHYTLKLWEKLTAYCQTGYLPISNERAENAIRPFAIARKNFLFFDTPGGATASANHYSLIMTAKANGLDPFYYLAYIFKELPKATCLEDYEALLPWNLDEQTIKTAFKYINNPDV